MTAPPATVGGLASDALLAAALFAVDPFGLGGVTVRARSGPARERWLACLRHLVAPLPWRSLPLHITDERLLGGLDLAATLHTGRPVAQRGVLASADGGIVEIVGAERMTPALAARIGAVLDRREVAVERDGLKFAEPTRFGVVMLDEGAQDDEAPPASIADRLALRVLLDGLRADDLGTDVTDATGIARARARLGNTEVGAELQGALCAAALVLGVDSLRASLFAVLAARASAALHGRAQAIEADAEAALRLVLAPRATRLPESASQPEPEQQPAERNETPETGEGESKRGDQLVDRMLDAAATALPPEVLAGLQHRGPRSSRSPEGGRSELARKSSQRGRPVGSRPGSWRAGVRLKITDTLRAAAPWQALRRRELAAAGHEAGGGPGRFIEVRREDLQIVRYRQRVQTTMIFAVDASGSTALQRLAEAKGAVEQLLAQCYLRRDRVALVAFRGQEAELLLPVTRSLVRAKRSLASLPGGGGTPLASGLEMACRVAQAARRRGEAPIIVLLTDGKANVARDGSPGRAAAERDALAAARILRAAGFAALLIDTARHPAEATRRLGKELGARYIALPNVDATSLARVVAAGAQGALAP
jgi:magnesium chelatase subunit D